MAPISVSIILPVLNEAPGMEAALTALTALRALPGAEIIVADGGSRDGTAELAQDRADRLVVTPPGRGRQMNAGAALARGEILLFLHADTRLPPGALEQVAQAIAGGADWGRFDVRIEGAIRGLGMVAGLMNWRSRLTGIATGDQAIFVTRAAFAQVGGYPEIPLMEDIVFSSKLRQLSRPACLRAKVSTSGRRWEKYGLLPTILKMWGLRLRFYWGASPAVLAREYGYVPHED